MHLISRSLKHKNRQTHWPGIWMKHTVMVAAVLSLISACSLFSKNEPPPQEPTRVVLEFDAAGDINPNPQGRASPLVVRIYHLKSYSVFEVADFNSLFENDGEVLGREMVDKIEVYLKPNEKRTVLFEPLDSVRTVGILAAFRYYDRGQWRVAADLQKNKTNVITISVSDTRLQIK